MMVADPALPEFRNVSVPAAIIVDEPVVAVRPGVNPTTMLYLVARLIAPLPSEPFATESVPLVGSRCPSMKRITRRTSSSASLIPRSAGPAVRALFTMLRAAAPSCLRTLSLVAP